MDWSALQIGIGILILLLGIWKAWRDEKQKKPGRNATRDIIAAIALASLVGIRPIIDLCRPETENHRYQREISQDLGVLVRQLVNAAPRIDYFESGIHQSQNLELRSLYEAGIRCLNKRRFGEAVEAFQACLGLSNLQSLEVIDLWICIGNSCYGDLDLKQAEAAYREALFWAKTAKHKAAQAIALRNLDCVDFLKSTWRTWIDYSIEFTAE